jgi:hypothetical protein
MRIRPNDALHLTGAAITVFRGMKVSQAAPAGELCCSTLLRNFTLWTVGRLYEQRVRHMDLADTGAQFVANVTLRLEPDGGPGVVIANAIAEEDALACVECVGEGVESFMARRSAEGRPIGKLRLTILALRIHPLKANPRCFVEATEIALARAFDAVGVEV